MSKKRAFKVGDTVNWTGKANGGHVEHVGVITKLRMQVDGWAHDAADVEEITTNKRTGKANKPYYYQPRISALILVKAVEQVS